MAKFSYKQGFSNVEIDIAREMISFKGKTIPAREVVGIGLGFTDIAKVAIGQALGGIIGTLIAQKGYSGSPVISKNLAEMPKSRFAQMIITYNEDDKQKFIRVPLNTTDDICMKMIHAVAKEYPSKFIGFGSLVRIQSELKISSKATLMIVIAIVLIVIGFTVFNILESQGYVHY